MRTISLGEYCQSDDNVLVNLLTCPEHMRRDYERRNENLIDGRRLCLECDGTGNEFFSMYHKCPGCDGNGWMPEEKQKAAIKTISEETLFCFDCMREVRRDSERPHYFKCNCKHKDCRAVDEFDAEEDCWQSWKFVKVTKEYRYINKTKDIWGML